MALWLMATGPKHRLSSFLLTKYGSRGCNAVGCANTNNHRPTNTRSCFSAAGAVLHEIEQRLSCVQAQRPTPEMQLNSVPPEMPRGPGTCHTNEHSVPPTCSEERRQLEPKLAFWSKFASAKAAHVLFLVPL